MTTCKHHQNNSCQSPDICKNSLYYQQDPDQFPKTNIYQEKDQWVYTFDIPGVKPSEIELEFANGAITLRGKKTSYSQGENTEVFSHESCVNSCKFVRSVGLPKNANPEDIQAEIQMGVLIIKIGKSKEKAGKKIKIRTNSEEKQMIE